MEEESFSVSSRDGDTGVVSLKPYHLLCFQAVGPPVDQKKKKTLLFN